MQDLKEYVAAFITAIEFHFTRYWRSWSLLIFALLIVGFTGYALLLAPPSDFPSTKLIAVKKGETVSQIATSLGEAHLVTHPKLFELLVRAFGGDRSIRAATYQFTTPINVVTLAKRFILADTELAAIRVTFPEGETARDMSGTAARALPEITENDFLLAAEPYEGYLFPDTYLFEPDATASDIVVRMRDNFSTRTASITPDILASGHTLSEIITMASIVEKEARTPEQKRVVAGILWHRIALHMPLQVDAVFGYINDRATYSPSFDDLSIDSPYNTYTHQGLPPGPIGNPGLDSIEAAVHPEKTNYLYYLTGRDGEMHYATTFAEHKANRAAYLD